MLMSHLGRPQEGVYDESFSLSPVADYLSKSLGQTVNICSDYLDVEPQLSKGEVLLLENVRFNAGEKDNDQSLGKAYARLCDIFVMDAFGTAHRAHASTYGVGMHCDVACAGPLLANELDALHHAVNDPARPMTAIVGGSKVSTKLTVLDSLCNLVDQLIPGGGIANTFIAAAGYCVGKSLYEPDLVEQAQRLMQRAQQRNGAIPVPVDVVVAKSVNADAKARVKAVDQVEEDDLILDIGPKTGEIYAGLLHSSKTIVWNGPVGVFELEQFSQGTRCVGKAIAQSQGFSIAGGGDTIAAVDEFNLSDEISYISTGGGAFLEFLEGKKLPAVEMLERKYEAG